MSKIYYLGIDIGGTKCAVTVAEKEKMNIIAKKAFPTDNGRDYRAVIDEIIKTAHSLFDENGVSPESVLAAGISCGGPLNSRTGVIMSPPNLPGWDNVPVCDILKNEFGFPVFLQNDANACALAEWKFGAGQGCENMVFLTFGTGMGAGLILNGRLYTGANDMAGEAGHIRLRENGPVGYGKAGSFEGFCSGGGIARNAKMKARELLGKGVTTSLFKDENDIERITAKSLAEAAENGDGFAAEIYSECGRELGRGLAVLIDILNPELIVIGSIYARSENLLRESMLASLKEEALGVSLSACRTVPAALGEKTGDYAALGTAAHGYERMMKDE